MTVKSNVSTLYSPSITVAGPSDHFIYVELCQRLFSIRIVLKALKQIPIYSEKKGNLPKAEIILTHKSQMLLYQKYFRNRKMDLKNLPLVELGEHCAASFATSYLAEVVQDCILGGQRALKNSDPKRIKGVCL